MKKVEKIDTIIASYREEIQELQEKDLFSSSAIGEKVSKSLNHSGHENMILKKLSNEEELQQRIFELYEERKEIIRTIEQIEDVEAYKVIYLRYIRHKTNYEIEAITDRSHGWVSYKIKKGLNEVQKELDRRTGRG